MLKPKKRPEEMAVKVSISLSRETLAKIDRIAAKARLSRSQLVSNLVDSGLDDALLCEAIGLVTLVGGIRALRELTSDSVDLIGQES